MSRLKIFALGSAITAAVFVLAGVISAAIGARPSVGACSAQPVPDASGKAWAMQSYRTQAGDGNCLQGYAWSPSDRPVRAALIVVHGIHDHARRYGNFAQAMSAEGIAVIAQDHRGHGGSGGARQRVDSAAQLAGDVDLAVKEAARRHPGVPVFLHGHSMGGMVAATYAAQHKSLQGLILSSAALKLPAAVSPGTLSVVGALSKFAPGLTPEAVDESQLVREPAARAALAADTIIIRDKLPVRTVATILQGIESTRARFQDIAMPVLILHGAEDKVTEVQGSRDLAAVAGGGKKTLRIFDGALHDLLHEPEGPQVTADIAAFVLASLTAGNAK